MGIDTFVNLSMDLLLRRPIQPSNQRQLKLGSPTQCNYMHDSKIRYLAHKALGSIPFPVRLGTG